MNKLRHISFGLKLLCHINLGRIFLFLLLLFSIYILPKSGYEWRAQHAMRGDIEVTEGEITEAYDIKPGLILYEYIFYSNEIGQHKGQGYGRYAEYDIGEPIRVVYSADDPNLNKAGDLDIARWTLAGGYFLIFMILLLTASLIWLFVQTHKSLKRVELGRLVIAERFSQYEYTPPGTFVRRYSFNYIFEGSNNQRIKVEINGKKADSYKKQELIALDPENENRVTFIKSLPGSVARHVFNSIETDR